MPIPRLDDLATHFTACTLPKEQWTHLAHLRVGAWHVARYGADEALDRLRTGIRRLNESYGGTNSDTNGYHETITAAYVRLIDAFLAASAPGATLDEQVAALLDGPLADKAVLLRFWSKEVLRSVEARRTWVAPNIAPLALPVTDGATPGQASGYGPRATDLPLLRKQEAT